MYSSQKYKIIITESGLNLRPIWVVGKKIEILAQIYYPFSFYSDNFINPDVLIKETAQKSVDILVVCRLQIILIAVQYFLLI